MKKNNGDRSRKELWCTQVTTLQNCSQYKYEFILIGIFISSDEEKNNDKIIMQTTLYV